MRVNAATQFLVKVKKLYCKYIGFGNLSNFVYCLFILTKNIITLVY